MALDNPALSRNPAFAKGASGQGTFSAEELRAMYARPSATGTMDGGAAAPVGYPQGTSYVGPPPVASPTPMTFENTLSKIVGLFVVLLAGAAVSWFLYANYGNIVPMYVGVFAGLILGLVNAFKREPSPVLILLYGAAEGLFVGGISAVFEQVWNGIVTQAVLATLAVFAATLFLFLSGKVRTSARMNKIVLVAMLGYLIFSLLNWGLMVFGVLDNPWGLRAGWLGIVIGIIVVFLAAYSLVGDFEFIQNGVRNKADRKYGWTGAFGLMVTLIWLYVEILRIIAIARSN